MSMAIAAPRPGAPATLPWLNIRGVTMQALLIVAAAVVLPYVAHATGAPVRWLLPMHWPVIIAGLMYGRWAGLAVGIAAPAVSLATSGMPPAPFVFIMMAELGVYGFATGALRELTRWPAWLAIAAALVAGRVVAIAIGVGVSGTFAGVGGVAAGYAPGIACAVAQIALLPILVRPWINHEQDRLNTSEAKQT